MILNKGTALPFYRSLLLQKPGELNLSHHILICHIMPHFASGVKLAREVLKSDFGNLSRAGAIPDYLRFRIILKTIASA